MESLSVDQATFRRAMSKMATPVTIVTTIDHHGQAAGFTASSVCSLSLDPPLILVCIAKTVRSHETFIHSPFFLVSVLAAGQEELAIRFATRGADKFGGEGIVYSEHGLPTVPGALTRLVCRRETVMNGGDHSILVGRVESAPVEAGEPLVYFDREFHALSSRALPTAS